jgi:hypothetical protein
MIDENTLIDCIFNQIAFCLNCVKIAIINYVKIAITIENESACDKSKKPVEVLS